MHRLLESDNTVFKPERKENWYDESFTYDNIGNILTLNREGFISYDNLANSKIHGPVDVLNYNYTEGVLSSITEDVFDTNLGGVKQTGTLSYDGNGNMKSNYSRDIRNIEYSPSNFPTEILTNTGLTNYYLTYSGLQLSKSAAEDKFYAGPLQLSNKEAEFISFSNGRYNIIEDRFEYTIADHLGNTVVRFTDDNEDGIITTESSANENNPSEVLSREFYYAFGMKQKGWEIPELPLIEDNPKNAYLYNNKEYHNDNDEGLYNYGFRFYDPAIARWNNIDPRAEMYTSMNPYNYVGNNPISNIDMKGDSISPVAAFRSTNYIINRDEVVTRQLIGDYIIHPGTMENECGEFVPIAIATIYNEKGYEDQWIITTGESFVKFKNKPDFYKNLHIQYAQYYGLSMWDGYRSLWSTENIIAGAAGLAGAGLYRSANITVDDILSNPMILEGRSLKNVKSSVQGTPNWINDQMRATRNADKGWVFREKRKDFTGKTIQYHPGSVRKNNGAPYWRVSDGSIRWPWSPAKS